VEGRVDLAQIEKGLNRDIAGVVVQSPNFFGTIENTQAITELARRHGALSIINIAEAVSLGILQPPEDADIVVGEAQSLGVPMSFGGPHVGFIATRDKFVRQMPGRLVGMGKDFSGRRAFVLTLSTREQHIRREKATSNICTNQSLCALMSTIYLAAVGPAGLREICEQNILKTDYAVEQIRSKTSHRILFTAPRFNEFVLKVERDLAGTVQRLVRNKIVPGLDLSRFYPELSNALLVCVTETTRKEQIDALVKGLA
jgi:glycine dehydrogenase subunit 1